MTANLSLDLINKLDFKDLDWEKVNNLIPAIIQDSQTLQVLMLGYMDPAALDQTCTSKKVTFYSRTKQRLWTKGETSGHELTVQEIIPDCDNDSLLVLVKPSGPCCHRNTPSCFGTIDAPGIGILARLEEVIQQRFLNQPEKSYTADLFKSGVKRIAQKVGEEGVEVALAAVVGDEEEIKNETADLLFHLMILLRQCNIDLLTIFSELRHRAEVRYVAEI